MEPSDEQIPPPKDWQRFERRMRDLFEAEWGCAAEMNGRTGQPQHGVDIYGMPKGKRKYHGVQCKKRGAYVAKSIKEPELHAEIRKAKEFRPKLGHFILATTGPRDAKIQKVARELNTAKKGKPPFSVRVMFWDDICTLYGKHPDVFDQHYRFPLRSLHQLPPPPGDFTGRKAELAELTAAVAKGGATISGVQGMGGVGKTALALVLARRLKDRCRDAQLFLDLRGASDQEPLTPGEAMKHVIHSYRPDAKLPEDEQQLAGLYRSVLDGQRALLLMDNAADAAQVTPLIPPPPCVLLVTSRQHFALPGLVPKDLDTLPPPDARRLLRRIAPRIGKHAKPIAELCGHLPLALCLAGGALAEHKDLAPEEYAERLTDARERLGLIDASLSLSYDLLDPAMRRRWSALAVFPDTFDRPAAAAVWATDPDAARGCLGELVRVSLLDWNESTRRYRLHDLARVFADSRLAARSRTPARRRQAVHYERVLREANRLYKQGGESVQRGLALFDREWPNIQAGQAWSAERADHDETARRLCNDYPDAGTHCLALRLHPRERIRWLEAGLATARRLKDRRGEGNHLGNLGTAYAGLGETRRAIEQYEQVLAISREIGDRRGEGSVLGCLGLAYAALGETRRGIEFHEQYLAIARDIGDRRGEGNALGNLGVAYAELGETRRAIEHYEQALAISGQIGDRRAEGAHLGNLGLAYADLGETRRAIECHEQALAISREIGDRRGEGRDLGSLGNAYAALGETGRAIEYHEQALVISREIGDRRGEGTHLGNLGNAYADLGETRRAIQFYEQALAIARDTGNPRGEGNALFNMSLGLDKAGDRAGAIAGAEGALAIFEEIEDPSAAKVRKKLAEWRGG